MNQQQAESVLQDVTVVFVTGSFLSDGNSSISIENREYLWGLDEAQVSTGILDMFVGGSLARAALPLIIRQATVGTLLEKPGMTLAMMVHALGPLSAFFTKLMLIFSAAWRVPNPIVKWLSIICGTAMYWIVRLLRPVAPMLVKAWSYSRSICQPHNWRAGRLPDQPFAPPKDIHRLYQLTLNQCNGKRADCNLDAKHVVCLIDGYDLMNVRSGNLWKRLVQAELKRHFKRAESFTWIVRVMNESTRVMPELVENLKPFDEYWVPAKFHIKSFSESGVDPAKLVQVPESTNIQLYDLNNKPQPMPIPDKRGFSFLTLFIYGVGNPGEKRDWNHARKASDLLIKAFVEEFEPDEDVCLVIKNALPEHVFYDRVATIIGRGQLERRRSQLISLGGWFHQTELPALYAAVDAFVLPTRGEGWGRPMSEAMAMGLPTAATNFSGNLEFMNPENSFLIDCEMRPVAAVLGEDLGLGDWAEPSIADLRRILRTISTNDEQVKRIAAKGAQDIREKYTRETVAQIMKERLETIIQTKNH